MKFSVDDIVKIVKDIDVHKGLGIDFFPTFVFWNVKIKFMIAPPHQRPPLLSGHFLNCRIHVKHE